MMNSALAQSQFFPTRTDILSAGRAPRYWKHELGRQVDLLTTTMDSSGWLKTFAEISPSFLDQPLLGNCLVEITSPGRQKPDEAAQTQASRSTRPLNKPTAISRRSATNIDKTTERTSIEQSMLMKLPRQAASSLLKLLAAPEVKSSSKKANSSVDILPLAPSRSGTAPLAKPSIGRTDNLVGDPEIRPRQFKGQQLPSVAQPDWRYLVANRAAKAWLRGCPSTTPTAALPPPPTISDLPVAGSASKPAASEISTSKILDDQWLTPLNGLRISPEILRRLINPGGLDIENNGARAERSRNDSPGAHNYLTVRSGLNSETATSVSGSWSDNPQQDFVSRHFEGVFPERHRRPFIPQLERDLFDQPAYPPDTDSRARESSSNFSPPSVTSSLPPLLPAASPGSPVLPLAAATSRYGAWRGEVDASEKDLSLLAAQMKRILDEEARRHGIDV